MLIITRKVGQNLVIHDNITVTCLRQSGQYTVLGITAPRWVPVYRQELLKEHRISYQHYLQRLDAVEPILEELRTLLDNPDRSPPVSIDRLNAYFDKCLESLEALQQLIHRFQSDCPP